jgi:DNA-binding winged helix-turn-helix (wHTH) protein
LIHFDRFELEPARRELSRDGESVEVGSRAFDILLALVRNRGRPVSKAELLELVWEGLVVEEGNVHVQISALRKLLGAHPWRSSELTHARSSKLTHQTSSNVKSAHEGEARVADMAA